MNIPNYSSIIWLTQGKYTIVDNDDYEWLSQFKWHYLRNGSYAVKRGKNGVHQEFMHRLIIKVPQDKITDHVNNNGLDNRKNNLRACTPSENSRNRKKMLDKTSKYQGVSWNKKDRKWRVFIFVDKKLLYLGSFHDELKAAKAYDYAAVMHYKEFAKTNQMMGLI